MTARALLLRAAEILEREAARLLLLAGPNAKPNSLLMEHHREAKSTAAALRREAGS